MFIRSIFLTGALLLAVPAIHGQEAQSTPTPAERRMAELQQEIDLLRRRQEYESAQGDISEQRLQRIMRAMPNSEVRSYDGKTEYADDKTPSPESVALSYQALRELSVKVGEVMKPHLAGYSGLVIYHEPDFLGLARYRLFRAEARSAFRNYDLVANNAAKIELPLSSTSGRDAGAMSLGPLTTALSLPSIGASYARSAADLLSVFRTDSRISESTDTVDNAAFGTIVANEFQTTNPSIKLFFPQAFVPEYDLDSEGSDSLIVQLSRLSEAEANLAEFVTAASTLPEEQRSYRPLKDTVALAAATQKQLSSLSGTAGAAAKGNSKEAGGMTGAEFRQLVRAEKLDRFLRGSGANSPGSRVGILKLRVLASGGSRKETRNLFLGNKITYSGSAVIEVLLFDADGTMRKSEVLASHTGFQKMSESAK